ncbi:conserved phage C-terminal domain-containing protein, partial [Bacillus mycoides]|uniref:conserved phage C-terminal domain-containing protein n=1 Tax=Bacillus mycoides TaxID=1405 RepID=UPI001C02ED2C
MAKYRHVQTSFWSDARVSEEMTPEDKYFYLYLMTNEHTNQIGVYQITRKQMAFELGYSIESAKALLDRFMNHHELVVYNEETREICILNWGKYNLNKGGKPIEDCIKKELKSIKDLSLVRMVLERTENTSLVQKVSVYAGLDDTCHDTSTIRGQKEKEKEKEKEKNTMSSSDEDDKESLIPYEDIVSYLNEKASKSFKHKTAKTRTLINARFKDGFTIEDFKQVIDIKTVQWLTDSNMNQYLRPETLFGTKFEGYLNEKGAKNNVGNSNAKGSQIPGFK